jgi:hypothetical protein
MSSYMFLDNLHSTWVTAVLLFGMGTRYVLLAEPDANSSYLQCRSEQLFPDRN